MDENGLKVTITMQLGVSSKGCGETESSGTWPCTRRVSLRLNSNECTKCNKWEIQNILMPVGRSVMLWLRLNVMFIQVRVI